MISTADERTSLRVTTNLPFEQWTEVLDHERWTGAVRDRLTHRCPILETGGESYRWRDARQRRAIPERVRSALGTHATPGAPSEQKSFVEGHPAT